MAGDGGNRGLTAVIQQDLAHAVSLATLQGLPPGWVTRVVKAPYALLFEWSGVHAMGQRFAETGPLAVPDTLVRSTYVPHAHVIELLMLATQLAGVRLGLILKALPLLFLAGHLGAAEGLYGREIRRATRRQESASLDHRAKYLQMWVLAMAVVFVLWWPFPMDIRYMAVPVAAMVGALSRCRWHRYKKHL
jgi:hypothetical protein